MAPYFLAGPGQFWIEWAKLKGRLHVRKRLQRHRNELQAAMQRRPWQLRDRWQESIEAIIQRLQASR